MRTLSHRSKPYLLITLVLILVTGANQIALAAGLDADTERPLAYTGCGGETPSPVNAVYEQQLVELVNAERAKVKLPPLSRADPLGQAARYHATDMGQDNYFSHQTYDTPNKPVNNCGMSGRVESFSYLGWSTLSENIAAGQSTPAQVMVSWMSSTMGHRENILNKDVWEIGVGYYQGSGSFGTYWVQDFGKRNTVYPLIINREAATTLGENVELYIYGSWSQVRVRVDGGAWSNWLPFQNSINWTLPDASGLHTIDVELKNGSMTATATDKIILQRFEDYPGVAFLPMLSR